MKCLAYKQKQEAESLKYRRKYGLFYMEWIDCVAANVLITKYGYGKKRLQQFFDHQREYLIWSIERYRADEMKIKTRMGVQKASEVHLVQDAMITASSMMEIELKKLGLVIDWSKSETDASADVIKGRVAHTERDFRVWWYEVNAKPAERAYLQGVLMYLHDECGFGKDRLSKFYDDVSVNLKWYSEMFLEPTLENDKALDKKLEELQALITSKGLEMEDEEI